MPRFSFDEQEGVSPVIGTIMMVAIAIVLAAVLFVIVAQLGKGGHDSSPGMAISRDEQADRLDVTRIDRGIMRGEYDIRMTVAGDFNVDQPIQAGEDAAPAQTFVRLAGASGAPANGPLNPGSYITFCAETGAVGPTGNSGPAAVDVYVELRHRGTNSIVWHDTFLTMADCPT